MTIKAVTQATIILVLMTAALFALAGTVHWFGGYAFLISFGLGGLVMTVWLAREDQALFKERTEAKRKKKKPRFDRIILPLMNAFLFAWIGAMALEVRWHGTSQMPIWINTAAGLAILAGFLLVVRVLKENTFATTIVRVQPERGHKVIDTGPYAVVRHPMYAAASLAYLATPFALGSKLGVFGAPVMLAFVAVRILFEEGLLRQELSGYCNYIANVRYRLVPFIW